MWGCSPLSLCLWGAEQLPLPEGKGCWVPPAMWEGEKGQLHRQHVCCYNTLLLIQRTRTPCPGYLMEPLKQQEPAAAQDVPSPSREHDSMGHWWSRSPWENGGGGCCSSLQPGCRGSNAAGCRFPGLTPERGSPLRGVEGTSQTPALLSSAASWLPFQSQTRHRRAGRGQPWPVALKLTNSVVTCWAKPMGAMP